MYCSLLIPGLLHWKRNLQLHYVYGQEEWGPQPPQAGESHSLISLGAPADNKHVYTDQLIVTVLN